MPLSIAIQMDPIESINIDMDSSFAIGIEAEARGHILYYYQPSDLFLNNGKVLGNLRRLNLTRKKTGYFTLGEVKLSDFTEIDVVLMRQDPPFDMNYITYTYMLERLPGHVMVTNNPAEVRNCPEKLFVMNFSQFMAPTLVTENFTEVEKFFYQYQDIVLKPLYAHGGADINRVNDNNTLAEVFQSMMQKYHAPLVAQLFLPKVIDGDKRIIFIDGKIAGAINRVPPSGQITANTVRGGTAYATELSQREREICACVGPELKKRGLLLAGIDVIDGYITEINVTSPTGLQAIDRIYGTNLPAVFMECIENYRTSS